MPLQKLYSKTASSHVFEPQDRVRGRPGNQAVPDLAAPVPSDQEQDHPRGLLRRGPDQGNPRPHPRGSGGQGRRHGQGWAPWKSTARPWKSAVCPWPSRDKVIVDITPLDLNQHIKVADITLPAGVKAVYEDNFAILGVLLPTAEEEETSEEGAAEAPAAAAPEAELGSFPDTFPDGVARRPRPICFPFSPTRHGHTRLYRGTRQSRLPLRPPPATTSVSGSPRP